MRRAYLLFFLKTSRQLHIAFLLLVIGLFLGVGGWMQISRFWGRPVDVALPLDGPVSLDVAFTTRAPNGVAYEVQIMPGLDKFDNSSKDKLVFETAEFRVTQAGKPVALRWLNEGHRCLFRQEIAFLNLAPGQRCVLHMTAAPVPAELRPLKPHLIVWVLVDARWTIPLAGIGLLSMAGIGLFLAGLYHLAVAAYRSCASYRAMLPPQ